DLKPLESLNEHHTFFNLEQMNQLEFKKGLLNHPTPEQALHLFIQRCYEVSTEQKEKQLRQDFLKFLAIPHQPDFIEQIASYISSKELIGIGSMIGGINAVNIILDPAKFIEKSALKIAY